MEGHKRHPAGASADNRLALQQSPVERVVGFAADQERTVPLGELRDDHRVVFLASGNHINAGFRAHQGNVGFACKQGCHALVAAAARYDLNLHAFIRKEAKGDRNVQRRIEYGACHLVERHMAQILLLAAAAEKKCST